MNICFDPNKSAIENLAFIYGVVRLIDETDPKMLIRINTVLSWKNLKWHYEIIVCPECEHEQVARVMHLQPFNSYIHDCKKCKHLIMESEWNQVVE